MFLSTSELERLTGKRRPSAQVRWLRAHGFRFTVNGLGEPIVALGEAHRKLVGGVAPRQEPDWGALNGTTQAAR